MSSLPEDVLIQRAAAGEGEALADLFQRYRGRLKRMVQLRLDRRVQGRVDSSDILQSVYLDAADRIRSYGEDPKVDFYVWVRFLTAQRLSEIHRRHLGAQARDARREISIHAKALPQASSVALAGQLLGDFTSPSAAAVRVELRALVEDALDSMEPIDREVLALRHFEELTNNEVAQTLGISKAAASNRYVRSLKRLRRILPPDLLKGP